MLYFKLAIGGGFFMSVDTSNKMQRERDYFQQALQRQQKSHDSEVESIRKANEYASTKQKESFLKQKNEMEQQFGDRLSETDKSQKEALFQQERNYNKILESQKEEFNDTRTKQLKDYDRKLSNIKHDFERNNKSIQHENEKYRDVMAKTHEERIKNIQEGNEKTLQEYVEGRKTNGVDAAELYSKEMANKTKEHERELQNITETELEKRNLLKEEGISDIVQIRKDVEANRIQRDKLQEETFGRITADAEARIKKMAEITSDQILDARDAQKKEIREQNRKVGKEFSEQELRNADYIRKLNTKYRANTMTRDGALFKLEEQRKIDEQNQLQKQRESLIGERNRTLEDSNERLTKANEKFTKDIQDLKIKQSHATRELTAKLNNDHTLEQTQERVRREEISEDFQKSRKLQDQNFEAQLANQKIINESHTEKLKSMFKNNLDSLQEKTQKEISLIKEEAAAEKREIAKKLNEQNSSMKDAQRQVFVNKINALTEGYEKKLNHLENQNAALKQQMVDTVNHITQTHQSKLEKQQEYNKAMLKTEITNERAASQEREMQLRNQMMKQEQKFTAKMDQERIENQSRLKALSLKYEKELDTQEEKYKDIIDQNKKFAARELARVKLAGDAERDRIIVQYEEQLKQMRNLFEKKEAELKQFNQLNNA